MDLESTPDNTLSLWKFQSHELRNIVKTARKAKVTMSCPENPTLLSCQFCDRSFLPNRLVVHNRSCTAFHPARKVNEHINHRKSMEVIGKGIHHSPHKKMMEEVPVHSSYNVNLDLYPHAFDKLDVTTLAQCACCARCFLPDRLLIHARSCTMKRPCRSVGNAMAGRMCRKGASFVPFTSSNYHYRNNWREWSSGFRSFVRTSKALEAHAHPTITQCPHCLKKYNEMAAKRHIAQCNSTVSFMKKMNMKKMEHNGKWRNSSQQFRQYVREARQMASIGQNHVDHWNAVYSDSPVPVV